MSKIDIKDLNAEPAFTNLHDGLMESIQRNTTTSCIKVKRNNPHAMYVNKIDLFHQTHY